LPKRQRLEAGHRQLGDLVARGCPSRLLDGMAGLLDGVIVKFSKDIIRSDHLVIVEGFRHSFAKHEDAPEHKGRGTADGCLECIIDRLFVHLFIFEVVVALANLDDETAIFIVVVTNSRVVGVITTGAPSTAPGLIGLKHLAG